MQEDTKDDAQPSTAPTAGSPNTGDKEVVLDRRRLLRGSASAGIVAITAAWLAERASAEPETANPETQLPEDTLLTCACEKCSCDCGGQCVCSGCVSCTCPGTCTCSKDDSQDAQGAMDATTLAGNDNDLAKTDQKGEDAGTRRADSTSKIVTAEVPGSSVPVLLSEHHGWVAGAGPGFDD